MDFEKLRLDRYSEQPYDFHWNPYGFQIGQGNDIVAHLPFLEFLARECQHITEFGTRYGYSTVAFLNGLKKSGRKNQKLVCYDIEKLPCVDVIKESIKHEVELEFHNRSTIDPTLIIEKTDFLFIDTLHTYTQVQDELLQACQVNRYIGLHDTFTDWVESREYGGPGIGKAITEFLEVNRQWSIIYRAEFNHGLIILEKQ